MIIFGGDRHTIGYNDIVMIRLEEILWKLIYALFI